MAQQQQQRCSAKGSHVCPENKDELLLNIIPAYKVKFFSPQCSGKVGADVSGHIEVLLEKFKLALLCL